MKCPIFPWNKYNIIAHQLHWTCNCKAMNFLWTQFLIVYTTKYNNKASNHNGEVIEYDSIQNTFKIQKDCHLFPILNNVCMHKYPRLVVHSCDFITTNWDKFALLCTWMLQFPTHWSLFNDSFRHGQISRIQIMTFCAQNIYFFSSIKYQLHNKMGTLNSMNIFIFLCWL